MTAFRKDTAGLERRGRDFKGLNDKRLRYDEHASILVDALDVGLYADIDPDHGPGQPRHVYRNNGQFWRRVLEGELRHGDVVSLSDFNITEWLPATPGRYFTEDAARARENAKEFYSWTNEEYLPLGKMEMVLGGVGSVRLAPRDVSLGTVCFFGASSTGVSHQGIPIICPIQEGKSALQAIRRTGGVVASITGTLWPLPLEKSPIKFDRGIAKYFLFAEKISIKGPSDPSQLLVAVNITYNSNYDYGNEVNLGNIKFKSGKNWSFASFNPSDEARTLGKAVKWLEKYTIRHSDGSSEFVPIFADFDQIQDHFVNPIEFPLQMTMRGHYDPRLLGLYAAEVEGFVINEVVLGDKFENIYNSTVINRSIITNLSDLASRDFGPDYDAPMKQVIQIVEQSDNIAAKALLEVMSRELEAQKFAKRRISQAHVCWRILKKLIPQVKTVEKLELLLRGW